MKRLLCWLLRHKIDSPNDGDFFFCLRCGKRFTFEEILKIASKKGG